MYEWKDKCLILCSFKYASSYGGSGQQYTQPAFSPWWQERGSFFLGIIPSFVFSSMSTSSSRMFTCEVFFWVTKGRSGRADSLFEWLLVCSVLWCDESSIASGSVVLVGRRVIPSSGVRNSKSPWFSPTWPIVLDFEDETSWDFDLSLCNVNAQHEYPYVSRI